MLRNKLLFFGVVALAITLSSPFIFYSYFEERPAQLNQSISFGGPFPFAEQQVTLPEAKNEYPLEVKFVSPIEKETNFKVTPFLFTFICFFLFTFSLYTIISNFFNGRQKKEPK
ncbi:hypothetical protein RRV45_08540 [Bacillus sp. DTU_2020_1000418_1_SI_GHA_SEK_038]|uniref:hypothetical protein n=1 Tax=Bacillus sp. DTU_2020_1000418_1_SI_GHA_SEK_038 TaxID=3077585 RepID=UPI0028ED1CC4|nr:hypothetical protein [Bacillus sp. DTU_2020_1000418_1_SI_GHA_SEK_038]WNS77016.1 hypothetical protein RRV45_08540 [Bacillus sp. DTU_2020_1000418_1_SI_GHA_SEK_038]